MENTESESNPLYKDVLEYLAKPKKPIKRVIGSRKNILRIMMIVLVVLVSGGVYYYLSQRQPKGYTPVTSETSQALPVQGEQSQLPIVCKLFSDIDQALKNVDIACVLDLSNQNLTDVPTEIARLTKLNELRMKNNRLTKFPAVLLQIPTLISLDFSQNQIRQIPQDLLVKLPNLQSVDFSQNQISTFSGLLQSGTAFQLRIIKLTDNPLPQEEKLRIKQLPGIEASL